MDLAPMAALRISRGKGRGRLCGVRVPGPLSHTETPWGESPQRPARERRQC